MLAISWTHEISSSLPSLASTRKSTSPMWSKPCWPGRTTSGCGSWSLMAAAPTAPGRSWNSSPRAMIAFCSWTIPRKIQSVAVNEVVRRHGEDARFLIRVDAHAEYPQRYCEHLLAVRAATDADSVVVSMRTRGQSCFQRAAAAAQNSILGNGGSSHRNTTRDRWVDHGHHALMTLEAFKAVGGYDETFSHNEDAELDARLTQARISDLPDRRGPDRLLSAAQSRWRSSANISTSGAGARAIFSSIAAAPSLGIWCSRSSRRRPFSWSWRPSPLCWRFQPWLGAFCASAMGSCSARACAIPAPRHQALPR